MYELFFLAASGAVGLVALTIHVFGRQIGHVQSLIGTLALVGSFTFAGAYGGLPPSAARVPVTLGVAFLYVPVVVGWLVVHTASDHPSSAVARVLPGAWMAGLVVALASQAFGPNLGPLVVATPGLFGVTGYLGFLAYNVALGVVVGVICLPLLAREDTDRGVLASFIPRKAP